MAEIARRLGEPKETVSYSFRSKIRKNGYSVHARWDRGALGLRDVVAVVDIASQYAARATDVMEGMDEHWFLQGITRTVPHGRFILQFTIPEEHYDEFPQLLERMKEEGFLTNVYQVLRFAGRRLRPMDAEHFDFRRGRWEFDWTRASPAPLQVDRPRPRQRFDLADLSILQYLMMDATTPMNEIAKRMKVSTKTAYRHARHVEEKHLIESHGIRWTKTQMNQDLGKPFTPPRKFFYNCVCVQGATRKEIDDLSSRLNSIPFLWAELLGKDYFAQIVMPTEQMVEGMSFMRNALAPVAKKSTSFMIEAGYGVSFTPPRDAFDDSTGEWIFDVEKQMSLLREQLKTVREESRLAKQATKYGIGPPLEPSR